MTWPETNARFDGECKIDGSKWKAGEKIYKIKEQYWCSNPNCNEQPVPPPKPPQQLQVLEPKPISEQTLPPPPSYTTDDKGNWIKIITQALREEHEAVWGYAVQQATTVYPVEWKDVPGSEGKKKIDVYLRERMILAEVFYKKLMDWKIHHRTNESN